MKSFLKSAMSHIHEWGEQYIAIPVTVFWLFGTIWLINVLTGRQPLESVDSVVGWQVQALGICIAASLTGLIQRFLIGYLSRLTDPPQFRYLLIDVCVTCFLLLLCNVLIFGLIR
jgi:hypothetical protein